MAIDNLMMKMSTSEIENLFNFLDKDKDGLLLYHEFRVLMPEN